MTAIPPTQRSRRIVSKFVPTMPAPACWRASRSSNGLRPHKKNAASSLLLMMQGCARLSIRQRSTPWSGDWSPRVASGPMLRHLMNLPRYAAAHPEKDYGVRIQPKLRDGHKSMGASLGQIGCSQPCGRTWLSRRNTWDAASPREDPRKLKPNYSRHKSNDVARPESVSHI